MRKITIFKEELYFENIKVGVDYLIIDGTTYGGITESGWNKITSEDIDILVERDKAFTKANEPSKLEMLEGKVDYLLMMEE